MEWCLCNFTLSCNAQFCNRIKCAYEEKKKTPDQKMQLLGGKKLIKAQTWALSLLKVSNFDDSGEIRSQL